MLHFTQSDYARHNDGVRRLQAAAAAGKPLRVPMEISSNPRLILSDPEKNPEKIGFQAYFDDPDRMAEVQMRYLQYRDTQLFSDRIMGWDNVELSLYPDFQNLLEPDWFGCPSFIPPLGDPASRHFLDDEHKAAYLAQGDIDPFRGLMGRAAEYHRYFHKLADSGYSFAGKPVTSVRGAGTFTDGPMTNACSIRGATDFCIDLYEDSGFAAELLDFVTENTIRRIKTLRRHYGMPEKSPGFFFADDSIALLSTNDYIKWILPRHKRLVSELSTGEKTNSIHLCGDATRHFKTIRDELNVRFFDTGFPVHHGALMRELGSDVEIHGGVHVDILLGGDLAAIEAETRRILDDVIPNGRRFVIKEANNLSPRTKPESLYAMYQTVQKYGFYERSESQL